MPLKPNRSIETKKPRRHTSRPAKGAACSDAAYFQITLSTSQYTLLGYKATDTQTDSCIRMRVLAE